MAASTSSRPAGVCAAAATKPLPLPLPLPLPPPRLLAISLRCWSYRSRRRRSICTPCLGLSLAGCPAALCGSLGSHAGVHHLQVHACASNAAGSCAWACCASAEWQGVHPVEDRVGSAEACPAHLLALRAAADPALHCELPQRLRNLSTCTAAQCDVATCACAAVSPPSESRDRLQPPLL